MNLREIRRALLGFYRTHRRDLPWRQTQDPYAIWVSEIMLQQTQVDTVVPRYRDFLAEFPTVEALAAATTERVCEAWAGLGYYSRARNLHAGARQVMNEHGGRLPRTAAQLQQLKGVGRYTAGAIASIAFDQPAPLVDGNVARVLSRLFAIEGPAQDREVAKRHWHLAAELVVGDAPGDLNQALMELGATVCRPKRPGCDRCPIARGCRGFAQGDPSAYPAPKPAPARKRLPIAFAWIETPAGVWLRQRPLDGLWAGLWELPSAAGRGAKLQLGSELGVDLGRPIARATHELTHRRVEARIYRPRSRPRLRRTQRLRPYRDPLGAPISALARKAIRAALKV